MIQVENFDPTERFKSDLKSAPQEVQAAAGEALKLLMSNPRAGKLRLHRLHGFKPSLWKIDIFPNKSWQIAFELSGKTAILKRLGTHSQLDRL